MTEGNMTNSAPHRSCFKFKQSVAWINCVLNKEKLPSRPTASLILWIIKSHCRVKTFDLFFHELFHHNGTHHTENTSVTLQQNILNYLFSEKLKEILNKKKKKSVIYYLTIFKYKIKKKLLMLKTLKIIWLKYK